MTKLRQLKNNVEVIGTLKTMDIETKTSRNNNSYYSGKMVLECDIDGTIYEQIVKIMMMHSSSYARGIETVMKEYKTSDVHGKENATRLIVTGQMELVEYHSNMGLRQWNEVKGLTFTRTTEDKDKSVALITTVIEDISDVLDENNESTGSLKVEGFTVNWNSEVVPLLDVEVGKSLAGLFRDVYKKGETTNIYYNILSGTSKLTDNRGAKTPYFGVNTEKTEEVIKESYINKLMIYSGDAPFSDGVAYSLEEIELAKQIRKEKFNSLPAPRSTISTTVTGFGVPF